jgi:hypothetical protein
MSRKNWSDFSIGVVGFSKLKVNEIDEYETIENHTIKVGTFSSIYSWNCTFIQDNTKAKWNKSPDTISKSKRYLCWHRRQLPQHIIA